MSAACSTCKGEGFVKAFVQTTVSVEDSEFTVTRLEYATRAVCPACDGSGVPKPPEKETRR